MPAYSHPYNAKDYFPAMPMAAISVSGIEADDPLEEIVALVDSGADATMIPVDILQRVGALYHEPRIMRGVTGHRLTVDIYLVHVQIGPYRIAGIEAIGMLNTTEAIIGRDVLNQLELTLHGPAHELWLA